MTVPARAALASAAGRAAQLVTLDITRLYETVGRRYPDRELLAFQEPLPYPGCDGPGLTGAQLRDLGWRLARALLDAGVTVNTRVVVAKRNHPDYLLHLWSTIAAGGIPVSVNAGTGWEFIEGIAELTGARVLVTDEDTLARAEPGPAQEAVARLLRRGVRVLVAGAELGPHSRRWQAVGDVVHLVPLVAAAPAAPPPPRRTGRDTVVAMFHTSGTTGRPKCCVWTQRNAQRIWKIMLATLPLGPSSRALLVTPFSHALYFALQTGGLLCGANTFGMSRFDPDECLRTLQDRRVTHVMAFPYVYMRLAAAGPDRYDLSSMRLWSTGADKAHAAHIAELIRHGGLRLRPGGPTGSVFLDSYGSTEIGAGGIVQLWPPGSTPEPCVQGRPMPTQFAVRIVDEQWRDLPRGAEGRILVRSSTHFEGYWNDHDRWAEQRIDGWWWGGDVGRIDERGRLLFLDREADSVRTAAGVLRTLPVEERLLTHPRVLEAAVFQRGADPVTGTGDAVAWVVPRTWLSAGDPPPVPPDELAPELLAWANAELPAGRRLAAVRVVPLAELPLGVTGKVLKRVLRERVAAGSGARVGSAATEGTADDRVDA